ncbi:MAG: MATE family efflux transporter [Lachnospiraceae bacterium]|nr:MATE family efflux transporter [Lachnospiraceae bacterium]
MELDMTKGKPMQLLLKFMLPLILGNVFQQFYNMVDTIIVGRFVGVEALAAVGATGTIMFLIFGFTMGLSTGFTVLTAQRFGAGDREGLKKTVGNATTLTLIITVAMTILSVLFMDEILTAMNTPENIYAMSKQYIVIVCVGMIFSSLGNLTGSLLRAVGNSKIPLYSMIAGTILNIVLDLLFVVVIPMGVAGVAIATVIAQATGGFICLFYIIKKVPLMHIAKEDLRLEMDCAGRQIRIGLPMALQFSITAVGTILVQAVLNLFGSTAIAAYTAACKVEQLVTQPYNAMGMTMATYSAQNMGVYDLERIRKGNRIANGLSAVYSVVVFGVVVVLLQPLINLFVGDASAEVMSYAKTYIYLCGTCFIPLGMIFIFRNILQGCGFAVMPMLGGVVELVCRIVAAAFAVKLNSFAGVCMANASSWLVTGIFLAIAYLFTMRKLRLAERKEPLVQKTA